MSRISWEDKVWQRFFIKICSHLVPQFVNFLQFNNTADIFIFAGSLYISFSFTAFTVLNRYQRTKGTHTSILGENNIIIHKFIVFSTVTSWVISVVSLMSLSSPNTAWIAPPGHLGSSLVRVMLYRLWSYSYMMLIWFRFLQISTTQNVSPIIKMLSHI